MRIVVLGTGPFAVPSLRALHASEHEVLCAASRPPRGRRAKPAPVFVAAEALGIETWLPETVNCDEALERLKSYEADLLMVCDYGEILKPPMLAASRWGGINLHGSLLPKYRGAAPVQWAVLNGDAETGNTVIQMTPGLDAGPALGVQRIEIDPDETSGELEARMADLGAELVLEVVAQLAAGTTRPVVQEKSLATKAPRLSKEMGVVDWSRGALEIKDQVRGLQPWPRAFTGWRRGGGSDEAVRLILHRVGVFEGLGEGDDGGSSGDGDGGDGGGSPPAEASSPGAMGGGEVMGGGGTVVYVAKDRLVVATGEGLLELLEIQPAGKRALAVGDFLRGYPVQVGDRLESQ